MKQKLIESKGEIDNSVMAFGDFSASLAAIDRTTRQKVNKELEDLNNKLNRVALTDLHRTLYSITVKCTFL